MGRLNLISSHAGCVVLSLCGSGRGCHQRLLGHWRIQVNFPFFPFAANRKIVRLVKLPLGVSCKSSSMGYFYKAATPCNAACRYEPVKIHDLKRLERVKAGMKLEDVKVRAGTCHGWHLLGK